MTVAPGQDITAQDLIKSPHLYAADAGSTDAYAISLPTAPSAYADGFVIRFKANTANTGASTLNVNTLGAIPLKRPDTTDTVTGDILANQIVEVVYRGGSFYITSPLGYGVPFFNQAIPSPIQGAAAARASGSSADGSVLYVVHDYGTTELIRYARDPKTGAYLETHSVDMPTVIGGGDYGAIIELGIYIYVFFNDGTNVICRRFLAADLTGVTSMTVPTVACTTFISVWTDGTYAYLVTNASDTTSRKWSVSGTTWSAVSTATVTTSIFGESGGYSSIWDGTNAYLLRRAGSNIYRILKLTAIDGSTFTTTDKIIRSISDTDSGSILVIIDALRVYIGTVSVVYDETGQISSMINLVPVSKP